MWDTRAHVRQNRNVYKLGLNKGQLNSELIHEITVSPKIQTKNSKDFCPTKQTRHPVRNSISLKINRASDNEGKFHSFLMCRI